MNCNIWLTLIVCAGALALVGCDGIAATTQVLLPTEPYPSTIPSKEPYPVSQSILNTLQSPSPDEPYPFPQPTQTPLPTPIPFLPVALGKLPPRLAPGSPVTISSIDMIDAFNGWAIGGRQDPGDHVLRTHDGGQTWLDVTPPYRTADENIPGKIRQAYFLDARTAWIAVYYIPVLDFQPGFWLPGIVWRTRDGGLTWEASEPFVVGLTLFVSQDPHRQVHDPSPVPFMQFLDILNGWILIRDTGSGMHKHYVTLYSTHDSGQTWEKVFGPLDMGPHGCHKTGMTFADTQTGWLTLDQCPSDFTLGITRDGGRTWDEGIVLPPPDFDSGLFQRAYCVDTHSPHLFSPYSGALVVDCQLFNEPVQPPDILYRTEDSGHTWQTSPFPGGELLFLSPRVGWALSREISRTMDGGLSWEHLKTVNWDGQFDFVDEKNGFAVARSDDQMALVRTFDGGRSWVQMKPVIAGSDG